MRKESRLIRLVPASRRGRVLALVALVALLVLTGYLLAREPDDTPVGVADTGDLVARARIEPAGRVHLVSGPSTGGTIAELKVQEGDRVRAGQTLAILDTFAPAQAAVTVAERDVAIARLERQRVSTGAKPADISAQSALVATREAELQRAQTQLDRANRLNDSRFISADQLEERALGVRRGQEAVNQARATLSAMTEIRPIDDRVAAAQIGQVEARLQSARAERDRAIVRAPIDGTVLTVFARSGAALAGQGLLTLGDIDRLIAVAEFDESVAARIRPGRPVTVTLRGDDRIYHGSVARVLNDVNRSERPTSDVLTGRDARIVETEIRFDPGQSVPPLIGAEATVRLRTGVRRQ